MLHAQHVGTTRKRMTGTARVHTPHSLKPLPNRRKHATSRGVNSRPRACPKAVSPFLEDVLNTVAAVAYAPFSCSSSRRLRGTDGSSLVLMTVGDAQPSLSGVRRHTKGWVRGEIKTSPGHC
jgi:hypothetical protein